ncbi:MAG: glycoside hydrolase family 15 protein [Pseudomonadota bacterium]|nr:glycoside hydrolase family 15 protein [Pseudomonadota bacterium]
MALKIEDYALIGDCETAALVGSDGSIDWLCWPRFDSDACFAALLGKRENGHFYLSPIEPAKSSRRYRKNTLILETTFETASGAVTVIDFMPLRAHNSNIVRIVRGERGEVRMCADLILRFGYGAIIPWVVRLDRETLRAVAGPDMVLIRTPVRLHGQDLTTVGEFTITAGQSIPFILTYAPSHLPPPAPLHAENVLEATETFWTDWSAPCRQTGEWSEIVIRSLITLKALTYRITGGIVAAPTTSLPEKIGGERNWDYRFCWLRDATLTLQALIDAGFLDEARAWREWLLRTIAGSPDQLQALYGIGGERRLTEWQVPWLDGYEGSRPVRIGNDAHTQLQIDVYGEMLDAAHQARLSGLAIDPEASWPLQLAFLQHLEKVWREPDEGIWEVRGGRQHFTHSKVMAWVAFDRAIKGVEDFGLKGPLERWRQIRAEIHAEICERGFDSELNSFVRSYGSKDLDASLLLLLEVGFLPPDDPRIRSTVAMIEKKLIRNGLLIRYDTGVSDDGLPPSEGAFLACSFWLADAYVLLGRHDDARVLFKRLIALANDVGLLSEEYDTDAKRMLGNFPQAFSHIALVNTAFNITRSEKPAVQRAETAAPSA